MNTVTLSAFRPEHTHAENAARQARLIEKMQRVGFELVSKNIGSYKGEREQSATFKVGPYKLNQALAVASFFEQESILLEQDDKGMLIFCESREVLELGKRQAIDETQAASIDAWTMTEQGDFFTYA
jgi:uncharacterized protein Smg (DUF494 family)